jgi:hypothetical protein
MSVSELYLIDGIIRHALRRHPRAQRGEVEWFLEQARDMPSDKLDEEIEYCRHVYRWNEDTVKAVRAGVHMLLVNGLIKR